MPSMDNAHALVIGIAKYKERDLRLPPTVAKDAQDIYNVLINPNNCAYPADNVKFLLDGAATRSAILQALEKLAEKTDQDSIVSFYISSHGGRISSGEHSGNYLLPADVNGISGSMLAQTAISGDVFTGALRKIPARKVTVLFDCCHSGGIGQPKGEDVLKAGFSNDYYEALKSGQGRVILASSRSDESSWVLPDAENSLFTQHLLTGLQGGIPSEDGLIRIFDLFEYIQPRITGKKPNQHPIFKAEVEENFPVALYLGGKKGTTSKVSEGSHDNEGFRYDAYVSYVEKEPDKNWVWDTFLPRLKDAGLRVAVSEDVWKYGADQVVNISRGIKRAKYILIVLSEAYLADKWARVQHITAVQVGVEEGKYRMIPIKFTALKNQKLPDWISGKWAVDLTDPQRFDMRINNLIEQLQEPLASREGDDE